MNELERGLDDGKMDTTEGCAPLALSFSSVLGASRNPPFGTIYRG